MGKSILDAIKLGVWDYEPTNVGTDAFEPTDAVPGSTEKLDVLADRVRNGLPLWHPSDRRDFVGRVPQIGLATHALVGN